MEDINSISVEDLERYYQNYYVPNNAVLVVSGDVDLEEVKHLTEKYFGIYESGEVERPEFIVDTQEEEINFEIESFTNVPITAMIYKIPEGNHPDVMAINVFLDILVNMGSSRVKQELQIKENLIMETGASPYLIREPGYALIYQVPMDITLVEKAQEAFDSELESL
ncbi:M16 family metallopeptidase [Natronospora cellulosivora (SeqCode)]